ncbi:MAG: hypothetical protein MI807_02545 [Verrucomicrobiales bacterium]|nr:hypothetical protein [Verrucomicrobiales bacterium]
MKHPFFQTSKALTALATGIFLIAGLPMDSSAYDDDRIKRVKVKDHKVKVKVIGGKAKIKNKRNGKEKVKVKGYNGELAAQIAKEAKCRTPGAKAAYYAK